MTQWEYKTIKVEVKGFFIGGNLDAAKFNKKLNELGRDGWELVAAFDTNMGRGKTRDVVAVFKRQAG